VNAFKVSQPYIFLETLRFNRENQSSFFFSDFADILIFNPGDNLDEFFKKAEDYLDRGYWLSGYFTYEFGYYLEPALYSLLKKNNAPLAWLAVAKKPKIISKNHKPDESFSEKNETYEIRNLHPDISHSHYLGQIKKIKKYLEEGLTYQVNFTFKVKFDFSGSPLAFYLNLRRAQPSSYAALIDTGKSQIISLSPELFFRIKGKQITARPMKGTIKRGLTIKEDETFKQELKQSSKTKAENIMIVDLLRNDLGRIAQHVWVPKLFEIEKYRTLYQMTSTIKARLKNNLKLKELFLSLFPSGSVTGAPKIKTMQIIRKLEKEPRHIYTGAMGYISPQREACFNVAIRTILLQGKQGEMGIGGGIVYDSLARSEYEEALLKAKFFMQGFPQLELIETMLLSGGQYSFLKEHLERLKKSSEYFSIPLNLIRIKAVLAKIAKEKRGKFKVRLEVDLEGKFKVKAEPLDEIFAPVKVKIATQKIDPNNSFLYHKTNQRTLYDAERKKALKDGFFEVIFLNHRGEVTEGSISNIFILENKKLYTPPVKCGLLPGVLRQYLLKKGKAREKIFYPRHLKTADKVYIGNSLRGLLKATL